MIYETIGAIDILGAVLRREEPPPWEDASAFAAAWSRRVAIRKFRSVREDFYRDISAFLQDGTDFHEAISSLLAIYTDDGKNMGHALVPALRFWSRPENTMRSLPDLLRGWAPSNEVMMIQAGEMAGADGSGASLSRMLDKTVAQIAIEQEMKSLFVGPIVKASGGLLISVAYIVYLALSVVPGILPYLKDLQALGVTAQSLVALQKALINPEVYTGLIPAAGILLWFVWSFDNWTGPWRRWADRKIEFYTIYKDTRGAIFLKALAPLLGVGKSHPEALLILANEGNPYERSRIGAAAQLAAESRGLGQALRYTGLEFPDRHLIHRLIAVEGRRTQADAIADMADRHLGTVRHRIAKFGVGLSMVVNFFVIAVFTYGTFAQFQIMQALSTMAR